MIRSPQPREHQHHYHHGQQQQQQQQHHHQHNANPGGAAAAPAGGASSNVQSPSRQQQQQQQVLVPALNMTRPPPRIPFFVREIYKNGFLKRLPYHEKKSSALSKLMRSDRYWVVFSVHDDAHPILELWNDPTEVAAARPPHYMYPLAVCQHISPCITPADHEWSFVVNFETVAIRFACNSRSTMEEWVDCVRNKLEEMGILNPKGNLYSRAPLTGATPNKVARNPMSPLPSPPVSVTGQEEEEARLEAAVATATAQGEARNRLSIVDASDQTNQTFTTSIYLNQTPPATPCASTSINSTPRQKVASSLSLDSSLPYETLAPPASSVTTPATPTKNHNSSSVYLNKPNPTRHVTVIPINNRRSVSPDDRGPAARSSAAAAASSTLDNNAEASSRHRRRSPSRRQRPLSMAEDNSNQRSGLSKSPPKSNAVSSTSGPNETPVSRKLSDKKSNTTAAGHNLHQRARKKSQRSSSLGPLLDESNSLARVANTNSLESIDSNPRKAAPRHREDHCVMTTTAVILTGRGGGGGAVPRRPLPMMIVKPTIPVPNSSHQQQSELSSPTRLLADLPPGIRPPPYHPVSLSAHPPSALPPNAISSAPTSSGFPPHIPLPGLTCQLSFQHVGPGPQQQQQHPSQSAGPIASSSSAAEHHTRSLREQQVLRLQQEIGHPAGVRLVLRRRDCINSLALVEFFGCLWVAGWKQRDFPVLYNAFHVGDQIFSAGGVSVRTANDFQKAVKIRSPSDHKQQQQQQQLHVEILIRRVPFAQIFHLRRDVDGQPLGIVQAGNTPEIREILQGSLAAQRGMTSRVRSVDGQSLVPWVITEINGRPVSLLAKEGEAGDRLQAMGRDVSVLVQPADVVHKLRKQLKSVRGYKEYVFG